MLNELASTVLCDVILLVLKPGQGVVRGPASRLLGILQAEESKTGTKAPAVLQVQAISWRSQCWAAALPSTLAGLLAALRRALCRCTAAA